MFRFFSKLSRSKKYVLVISGGGVRGFYALGVLKGLEELKLKNKIGTIYGVSAGGIASVYRSAGYSADKIFELFLDFGLVSSLNLLPKKSLFKHDKLIKKFESELPKTFDKLEKKVYLGCTDLNTSKYILFDKGDLISPLLGTMSIPGVFPPVEYEGNLLADGGLVNNFPVDIAKKHYPRKKIIGIFLNYFNQNQEIKTFYSCLNVALDILLRSQSLKNVKLVDYLFYRKLDLKVLEINKKKMTKIFDQGYRDCLSHFKK